MTVREVIYLVRNQIKMATQDVFITDRFIYGVIIKNAYSMLREIDKSGKMYKLDKMYKSISFIPLVEINNLKDCLGLDLDCYYNKMKRTKYKIRGVFSSFSGLALRNITSIDGSYSFKLVNKFLLNRIVQSTSYKYNKQKYTFYQDGYLWFPDTDIEAISLEGIFTMDVEDLEICKGFMDDPCVNLMDSDALVPDYLLSEIIDKSVKDLLMLYQIPSDKSQDVSNQAQ